MHVETDHEHTACVRSREWASLRVDGELSMLESRMHALHLERCPSCAAFDAEVAGLSSLLRATASAAPSSDFVVSIPRRGRLIGSVTRSSVRSVAAAATIACAVALGVILPLGGSDRPPAPEPGLLLIVDEGATPVNDGELLRAERGAVPPHGDEVQRRFGQVM